MTTDLLTPAERLNLSRERLRKAMNRSDKSDADDAAGTSKSPAGLELLDLLKLAIPSASLVIDAVKQWWSGHPLKASGNLVGGVADEVLRPLAKKHPLALVAGAVALGAVLVWIRPWRWALRPQVMTTWGPAVISSAIASSAVQNWLLGVLTKSAAPPQHQQPQPQPQSAEPPAQAI